MDILFAGLKEIKEMKVFILQTILHLMSELILTLDRYKLPISTLDYLKIDSELSGILLGKKFLIW